MPGPFVARPQQPRERLPGWDSRRAGRSRAAVLGPRFRRRPPFRRAEDRRAPGCCTPTRTRATTCSVTTSACGAGRALRRSDLPLHPGLAARTGRTSAEQPLHRTEGQPVVHPASELRHAAPGPRWAPGTAEPARRRNPLPRHRRTLAPRLPTGSFTLTYPGDRPQAPGGHLAPTVVATRPGASPEGLHQRHAGNGWRTG